MRQITQNLEDTEPIHSLVCGRDGRLCGAQIFCKYQLSFKKWKDLFSGQLIRKIQPLFLHCFISWSEKVLQGFKAIHHKVYWLYIISEKETQGTLCYCLINTFLSTLAADSEVSRCRCVLNSS